MNQRDGRLVGQVFEPVTDRLDPRATADRQQEAINVALKDPWWRIRNELTRDDTHDGEDVGPRHERLEAVEEHRLAGHPAKLLQLTG